MIVPQYWAEGRVRARDKNRQITVRRFGWSNESLAAAQTLADQRAQEALARLLAGENLLRSERKVSYNGAEGVPIREEVISRHDDAVITRNIYGARCLNHPSVLFADIDFEEKTPIFQSALAALIGIYLIWHWMMPHASKAIVIGLGCALFIVVFGLSAPVLKRLLILVRGNAESRAVKKIAAFMKIHPDWHIRQYRTPAGFRLLAMHRTFLPNDPSVIEFFQSLGVDKRYTWMCQKQQCFRARVSPKPWRIGISAHIKPRPGVWPIKPERLPDRVRWVDAYELKSTSYASCRFVTAIGSSTIDRTAQTVQTLHDELCRAESSLPIA